jgi:hypothetical protein
VDVNELIERYPQMFHLAEAGSARAISVHGLLPAQEIVSTSALRPEEQAVILSRPRPQAVTIDHPLLGRATLRDQTPLRAHILDAVLTDMTARQWLSALNEQVFFWLHPQRLDQLLNARRNRGRPHDVLVIDTASLVDAHSRRIRLSAINSGSTLYPNAPERGTRTFQTIEDYPFAERLRRRTPQTAVVELAVPGGVRDIAEHIIDVHRVPALAQSAGRTRQRPGTRGPARASWRLRDEAQPRLQHSPVPR